METFIRIKSSNVVRIAIAIAIAIPAFPIRASILNWLFHTNRLWPRASAPVPKICQDRTSGQAFCSCCWNKRHRYQSITNSAVPFHQGCVTLSQSLRVLTSPDQLGSKQWPRPVSLPLAKQHSGVKLTGAAPGPRAASSITPPLSVPRVRLERRALPLVWRHSHIVGLARATASTSVGSRAMW